MFQSFPPPPVGYSQPTTGVRDYCTTQSAGGSIELTGPASPYYSSPESRSSDTLDRNLTPASDVAPSYHRTFELPVRTVGHHPPSSQGMLPSPPASTTYDGEDSERLRLQLQSSSTSFPVSSIQSSGSRLVGPPTSTNATSWSTSSTSHQPAANFDNSLWPVSNPAFSQVSHIPQVSQVSHVSQVPQGINSTQFDPPLEHHALESPLNLSTNYNFTDYNQHNLEPQTPAHQSEMAMLSEMGETPGLSSHEASPAMTNDLMELYQLEDEVDMHDQPSPADSMRSHGSQGAKGKDTTPYAKLIFGCLMAAPNKTMSLQDIYRWFEQHTDKGHDGSKGWQNSIRHNLSMNKAFKKTNRERSGELGSSDASKKSTDWTLEEWAINQGVQSTTRYRKGSGSRRTRKGVSGGVNKSTTSGNTGPRRCVASSRTPESVLTRAGRGQIVPTRNTEGNGYSQRPYRAPQVPVDVYHQQPTHQTSYYSPGHMHLSSYHASDDTGGASPQNPMIMSSSMNATTMPTANTLTSSTLGSSNNALHNFNYGPQSTAPVQGMTNYHQPQYTNADIGLNRIAGVYSGAADATSDHMGESRQGAPTINNMAALNRSFFPSQQQPDWNSVISDGTLSDRIPYHH